MRRLDYEGMSLEAMRLTVMEVLLMEERYRLITHVLDASNLEESMIQFEKAVPCLLHLENRISEIIIYHLLQKCRAVSTRISLVRHDALQIGDFP